MVHIYTVYWYTQVLIGTGTHTDRSVENLTKTQLFQTDQLAVLNTIRNIRSNFVPDENTLSKDRDPNLINKKIKHLI